MQNKYKNSAGFVLQNMYKNLAGFVLQNKHQIQLVFYCKIKIKF